MNNQILVKFDQQDKGERKIQLQDYTTIEQKHINIEPAGQADSIATHISITECLEIIQASLQTVENRKVLQNC